MTGAAGGSRFEPLGYGRHLEAARPVLHVLALLLVVLGVAMLLPAAVDLHVANPDWKAFVGGAAATLAFAAAVALATRGTTGSLTRREAFVLAVGADDRATPPSSVDRGWTPRPSPCSPGWSGTSPPSRSSTAAASRATRPSPGPPTSSSPPRGRAWGWPDRP